MKLSNYIEYLQETKEKHGDIECVNWVENDDWDSSTEGWFEPTVKEDVVSEVSNRVTNFACTYINSSGEKNYSTINDRGYIDCQQEMVFVVRNKSR